MFFIVLGIFLWILFAFWPAWVAKNRGYSPVLFFILSLFLFFISLIIAYSLPDKTKTKQEVANEKAAEKALEKEENIG